MARSISGGWLIEELGITGLTTLFPGLFPQRREKLLPYECYTV